MLDIHRTDSGPDTKTYFSHSVLPAYIDPHNVSMKKQPFSTFNKHHFSHRLDLIIPEELWEAVRLALENNDRLGRPQYARVHMTLGEIIESEFLESYIKQGNIMMLSEGRPRVDNRFDLYEGILRMELDRPTYERCGLQGVPIEDGGKKHQKQRWIVQYNLRDQSMKHGKKRFSRLEWACKNVLNQSLTWLFYNFNPSFAEALAQGAEVISKHAPWTHPFEPVTTRIDNVLVPSLSIGDLNGLYAEEDSLSLLEYLQMVTSDSPRLSRKDSIDPHLSRYEVPDFGNGISPTNLVLLSWKGFISPAFGRELFITIQGQVSKGKSRANGTGDVVMDGSVANKDAKETQWFTMSAQGFGGNNGWTVMQFTGRGTLVWETEA
ncbi:ribonuclease P 40kDa subunit-domain-containing protein [Pyrenochaeta sp. MPI-SDFR-AT-0127]|nr:ribonuclease P 40kDa subunit-domain-containing protein [Pyrenochaeta sp. MPI-SDFR-AT-0127]